MDHVKRLAYRLQFYASTLSNVGAVTSTNDQLSQHIAGGLIYAREHRELCKNTPAGCLQLLVNLCLRRSGCQPLPSAAAGAVVDWTGFPSSVVGVKDADICKQAVAVR